MDTAAIGNWSNNNTKKKSADMSAMHSQSALSFATSLLNGGRASARHPSNSTEEQLLLQKQHQHQLQQILDRSQAANKQEFLNDCYAQTTVTSTTTPATTPAHMRHFTPVSSNSKLRDPNLAIHNSQQTNGSKSQLFLQQQQQQQQQQQSQQVNSNLDSNNPESIELIKINKSLKSKVYSSYLVYSAANPFSSNFDLINKQNPEFYETLSKEHGQMSRFSRLNSSLSVLNNYLDQKKIEGYLLEDQTAQAAAQQQYDEQRADGYQGKITAAVSTDQKSGSSPYGPVDPLEAASFKNGTFSDTNDPVNSNTNNSNTRVIRSKTGGGEDDNDSAKNVTLPKTYWSWAKHGHNIKISKPTAANLAQNQFLNYRKDLSNKNDNTCKWIIFD
jgi:hypothetical protein